MKSLPELFNNNRQWATNIIQNDPSFFQKLVQQQSPDLLWIGCSDSRVPANEIVGLLPGELFVHRNVANLVIHSDMNCLSVIQYAIEILNIHHIIVCGHYDCGGIKAAIEFSTNGLIDNWLGHVRDIYQNHYEDLAIIHDTQQRINKLCELNVMAQVKNVANTTFVQTAWANKKSLFIHGWIYSISNGLLKDLELTVASSNELKKLVALNKMECFQD